jgi:hypothetical protein
VSGEALPTQQEIRLAYLATRFRPIAGRFLDGITKVSPLVAVLHYRGIFKVGSLFGVTWDELEVLRASLVAGNRVYDTWDESWCRGFTSAYDNLVAGDDEVPNKYGTDTMNYLLFEEGRKLGFTVAREYCSVAVICP